jgi:hypothetical protein
VYNVFGTLICSYGEFSKEFRKRTVINANGRWFVIDEMLLLDCGDDRGWSLPPTYGFGAPHYRYWDICRVRTKDFNLVRMALSDLRDWSDKPSLEQGQQRT